MSDLLATIEIDSKNPAQGTVIWMHGLGASADDFVSIIPMLALPDDLAIRFVFPQAPTQPITLNAGYHMPAWYDIYDLSLQSPQDETGIRQSQSHIEALIEQERQRGIAVDKIVLAGFSQGGAIALHTALRFSQTLAGVMALSSYLPLVDFLVEEKSDANQDTPIFIAHGHQDDMLPIAAGEMTCERLIAEGYKVDWHVYEMAHQVCAAELTDISVWLQQIFIR
jgi:phospholipase/carboxylesterase